jgi:hypothetical protein
MKKKICIYSFIGLFIYLIIAPFPTFAQEQNNGIDITVSPSLIDITNVPGSTVQGKFRIRNNLDTAVNLQISIGKLLPNGKYDTVDPSDVTPKDDFIKWLTFNQASISALPKEWTTIMYKVSIPKDAAFGYYYAIKITQARQNALTASGSKIRGEVLIPLLLNVKNTNAIAEGKIVEFHPVSFLNEYLPVDFITRIASTGNIHIKPAGNIFIRTRSEKDTAILDVNPSQGIILPGGVRTFMSSWDDGFFVREPIMEEGVIVKDTNGKPMTRLTINWDMLTHFRIGPYTANLLLVYDNGKRDVALEATTTFWVFPYTIIGSATIAIIVIVLLTRFCIQLYIKRQLKKYKREGV